MQVVFAVWAAVALELLFPRRGSASAEKKKPQIDVRREKVSRDERVEADAKGKRRTVFGSTMEQTMQARFPRRWVSALYLSIVAEDGLWDDDESSYSSCGPGWGSVAGDVVKDKVVVGADVRQIGGNRQSMCKYARRGESLTLANPVSLLH